MLLFDASLAVVLLILEMIALSVGPDHAAAREWLYNAVGLIPVVIRRRWTWIAILLAAVHAALPFVGIPLRSASVAVLAVTYTAAVRLPIRQAICALWLLWAPVLVLSAAVGPPYRGDSTLSTVYYIAFSTLSALVSFLIGRTVATRRAYVAALEDRARTAETSQQALTDQAVAEERRRIARELHDVVAHHVSVMGVLATGSRRMLARDPAAADEALATIEETGRTALREMRRLLTVLRADAEPAGELAPQPGLAGVEILIEQMREAGLPASLKVEGVPGPLDPGVALTVYRIVQEALTNALKHAGAGGGRGTPVLRPARADRGDLRHRPRPATRLRSDRPRAARHARTGHALRRDPAHRPPPGRRLSRVRENSRRQHREAAHVLTAPIAEPGRPVRILLADDQPLLRTGFRMVLGGEPDLDIVAEAGDGVEAVDLARRLLPDVVLMDIRMPRMDGVAATRTIVEAKLPVRVLILTTFDLDEYVVGALRAGASGFLAKDVPADDLVAAIRTVAAGEAVVAPRILKRLLDKFADSLPDPAAAPPRDLRVLTDREREVLVQLARGTVQRGDRQGAVGQRDDREDPRRAPADQARSARPGPGGRTGVRDRVGPTRILMGDAGHPRDGADMWTASTTVGCEPAPTVEHDLAKHFTRGNDCDGHGHDRRGDRCPRASTSGRCTAAARRRSSRCTG